jgi:hypothetical protein
MVLTSYCQSCQRPHLQVRARTHILIACARAHTPTLAPSCTRIRARAHPHTHFKFTDAHSFPSGASELTMYWFCLPPQRFDSLSPLPSRRPASPPRLTAPPRHQSSLLRPRHPSESSPPHLVSPPRRAPTCMVGARTGGGSVVRPGPVAAPSSGPDRRRLCLRAPTCLHPLTCPYGTDARGQSHHPHACLYSTDASKRM